MLDAQTLRNGLRTRLFGRRIFMFDSIDSTNNCARALAECWSNEGTVVVAEYQTAGRGRLGRSWVAARGENLMLSLILRPELGPDRVHLLSLVAAVATAEAIERATGLSPECKWPNDLLIKRRKCAGILLEGSVKQNTLEYVIVGVGINVNQATFPEELETRATSLRRERGSDVDRALLYRSLMTAFESLYTSLAPGGFAGILPLWRARATMIDRPIVVDHQGTRLAGVVRGVNEEGALQVDSGTETHTFYAGDVTITES
jgi:BirA family biotin operon repressor/biotin-[acetyl-CoA-carboxylase] ligase